MTYSRFRVCALAALLMNAPAIAGPDWVEMGDAGSTVMNAQAVLGVGQILSITGTLGGSNLGPGTPDYEDMYLVRITQPTMFSFQSGPATFNPQCFLFNITLPGEAFGLLANDDTAISNLPRLVSPATDGTGAAVMLPGEYAIAISGFGRVPVSLSGPIFNFLSTIEVSGPDGPGGINPHIGWSGVGETGTYQFELEGVDFYDVPAPGVVLVLTSGIGLLARRRRV